MRRLLLIACLVLAGCGGGGGSAPRPPAAASPSPIAVTPVSSGAKNLSITIVVPTRGGAAHGRATQASRHPSYVPANGATLDLQLSGTQSSPTFTLNLSTDCSTATPGVYTCAISVAPDKYDIDAEIVDSNNALLSTTVSPLTSVVVTGGTNSATITLLGVVASVYMQMPLLCIDPGSLHTSSIPLRFLDAQGEEISGTFAYPVTVSSSNPSVAFPATSSGTSIFGTPVTGDPTVPATAYPTIPGYEITGSGTNEGYVDISAVDSRSDALNVSYGPNFTADPGSSPKRIYVNHHFVMVADPTQDNINVYGVLAGSYVGQCDTIEANLHPVYAVYADGSSDVVAAAGGNPGSPGYASVVEFNMTPANAQPSLNWPSPPYVTATEKTLSFSDGIGTLSLTRSASSSRLYLANTGSSFVREISDSGPSLTSVASYSNNAPTGFFLGLPESIAVVHSSTNGDVLLVPDSSGTADTYGGVGIITHAEVPASATGSFNELNGPDIAPPVRVYASSSYSNGSTQTLSFTAINYNSTDYVNTFDANFTSGPTINATTVAGLLTSGNTLTTGNADTDYYLLTSSFGICYDPIGDPIMFNNSNHFGSGSAIATAGDNSLIASVNGTNLIVVTTAQVQVPGTQTVGTGSIPAIYTR